MDGAVQSGERAAHEALTELVERSSSTRSFVKVRSVSLSALVFNKCTLSLLFAAILQKQPTAPPDVEPPWRTPPPQPIAGADLSVFGPPAYVTDAREISAIEAALPGPLGALAILVALLAVAAALVCRARVFS